MNRPMGWLVVVLALGCDKETSGDEPQGEPFALRVLGENAADYGSLYTSLRSVTVTSEGRELPVRLESTSRAMDLTDTDNAHLGASFWTPRVGAGESVEVTATFDDYGVYETAAGAVGSMDARGTAITFSAPLDQLVQRRHAVLHVDVGKSLADTRPDVKRFLPNVKVMY